jgi:hypothetical protein
LWKTFSFENSNYKRLAYLHNVLFLSAYSCKYHDAVKFRTYTYMIHSKYLFHICSQYWLFYLHGHVSCIAGRLLISYAQGKWHQGVSKHSFHSIQSLLFSACTSEQSESTWHKAQNFVHILFRDVWRNISDGL